MKVRSIYQAIVSSIAIKSTGSIVALAMFLYISRSLNVEEFGEFSFGFSAAQFLAVVVSFGAQTMVLKETSAELGQNSPNTARSKASSLLILTAFGCILGVFLSFVGYGSGQDPRFWLAIGVLSALLCWSEFASCMIRGYGGIALALLPREIAWRLTILIIAAFLIALQVKINVTEWIIICAGTLAIYVVVQWKLFHQRPTISDIGMALNKNKLYFLVAKNFEVWLIAMLGVVDVQFSILIVRYILDAISTGLLFVAIKISAIVALPLIAAGQVVAPQISIAFVSNNLAEIQRIGAQTSLVTTSGAIVSLTIILLYGDYLLSFFGTEFTVAWTSTIILACAQVIGACLGPTGFALLMMGHQRVALIALCIGALVSAILVLVLGSRFGIEGAAIGVGAMLVVNKIICYAFLWRFYGLHLSILGFVKLLTVRSEK